MASVVTAVECKTVDEAVCLDRPGYRLSQQAEHNASVGSTLSNHDLGLPNNVECNHTHKAGRQTLPEVIREGNRSRGFAHAALLRVPLPLFSAVEKKERERGRAAMARKTKEASFNLASSDFHYEPLLNYKRAQVGLAWLVFGD